jgi:hypothetical protein
MGVKIGAQELKPPPVRLDYPIEHVIPGSLHETAAGYAYLVEQSLPAETPHGDKSLQMSTRLDALAQCIHEPYLQQIGLEQIAFLDTETSGLSGGTGTYAFLIGAARYIEGNFHLVQFFMRDPGEESALLLELEKFLAPCQALVSFNGKSFDVPLLNARYTLQGWASPLENLIQVDLLHLARRLWRERLPSRTLGNLEVQILGVRRTADEVQGWMIPQMYFDYLLSGDARPLKKVFYHNAMDVITMAALLEHVAHLLADPINASAGLVEEQAALGRLYEDLGDDGLAEKMYLQSLQNGLPEGLFWNTLEKLSYLYKRSGEREKAMELWQKAAKHGHIYAHIELAKIYEHTLRDYAQALHWTQAALDLLQASPLASVEASLWRGELEHRRQRLELKHLRQNG